MSRPRCTESMLAPSVSTSSSRPAAVLAASSRSAVNSAVLTISQRAFSSSRNSARVPQVPLRIWDNDLSVAV
eukprot:6365976-Pyramimonas_sp.AAC.1